MEDKISIVSEADRLVVLMEEIAILQTKLKPAGTGHIHTTISTLQNRVNEIREKLNG
jgi:ethanolamine utilization protein EutP (predicted NTPase)|tara:strand:+ start:134 stop:304 length:171 start_codon:yes stop_codon:yes gene_type:complete